jgi:hypothetical protein
MQPLSTQISFAEDSLVSSHRPLLEGETTLPTYGRNSDAALIRRAQLGFSLKMSLASEMEGLSGFPVNWSSKVIGSGRSVSILRPSEGPGGDIASFGWPTPTAKANHDAPSMRKWPAYRRYQTSITRTFPRLWEWMMGFPEGWTDCTNSEMPSLHTRPKLLGEPS